MLAPFVLHGRAVSHVLMSDVAVGAIVLIVSLAEILTLERQVRHS
jgi:hypothetical protein